jgi:hypothetical protein
MKSPETPPRKTSAAAGAQPSGNAAGTSAAQSALESEKTASPPRTSYKFHLSDAAAEKLSFHTTGGKWTNDSLVEELIRTGLHKAFAGIKYRGQEIAEAKRFRVFDHTGGQNGVVLKTSLGEYRIQPRRDNPEFKRWMQVYAKRGVANFSKKAAEMCLFLLGQQLQEIKDEEFTHIIYPEDFLVEQFV